MLFPRQVSSRSSRSVRVINLSGEDGGEGMAFTTTDLWFSHISQSFTAVSFNAHFPLKERKGTIRSTLKNHVGAGIGKLNFGNRARKAEVAGPIL